MWRTALVALMLFAGGTASAHDFATGGLQIDHPWIRATPPGVTIAGGYLAIVNTGMSADRLLSVTTAISSPGLIHVTTIENGVARMVPLDEGVLLPPGETVTLDPVGMHIMFEDLTTSLAAGAMVEAVLVFELAGEVPVIFNVEPIGTLAPVAPHHGG